MKSDLKKVIKVQNRLSGIFYKNPVFSLGLAIPIVVMGTHSLKTAVAFCVAGFITIVPGMLLASICSKHFPLNLRVCIYVLFMASILAMASGSIKLISPGILDSLGMYYSLMAINTIVLTRGESKAGFASPLAAALDGFCHAAGFALAMLAVAAVREPLGSGTLWGTAVGNLFVIPGIKLPFMGFIFIGFFAAGSRVAARALKKIAYGLKERKKTPAAPL